MNILDTINFPNDLKKLNKIEKIKLAQELRELVINTVSNTGGHLASNLGVVEVTIALHSIFDTPQDQIVWDVGHQTYINKILTGRKERIDTLRSFEGLAGFPKTTESEYDIFNTGHSSTSISAALGLARARDIKKENNYVIAVIGDGALTGGMALEALNDAGFSKTNLIVVLNDNEMSIAKNVGGISNFLTRIRTRKLYNKSNRYIKNAVSHIPKVGNAIIKCVRKVKYGIKQLIIPNMFFEDLGFKYLGPVDGNNIEDMEEILKKAKDLEGPILIHAITKKGKGYKPAEENPDKFHSTSAFNINTGKLKKEKKDDYSKVFGESLVNIAKEDEKIVAVTAAMRDGTGLTEFAKEFPERFFDVGIAEQHALTMCAGMAKSGLKPVISIYSSFYQRGYDQVIHDICMQNLPVVMCVDRAGIVGNDGETHQGLLDMAFFKLIPNLTIMSPKDFKELEQMLEFAVNVNKPVVIRYPRGGEDNYKFEIHEDIKEGKCEIVRKVEVVERKDSELENIVENIEINEEEYVNNHTEKYLLEDKKEDVEKNVEKEEKICKNNKKYVTIIAIGNMISKAMKVAEELSKNNIEAEIINARFIKPLDKDKILESINKTKKCFTIEDGTIVGGLGTSIKELVLENNVIGATVKTFAYPDKFIEHGSIDKLEEKYGMDIQSIYSYIKGELEK